MSAEIEFSTEEYTGDTITCRYYGGGINVEIDSPWHGDTETGFGATLSARLTMEQAQQLRDFLNEALREVV